MVIRPTQELLIDAFDKILSYNGIKLDLYFQTLKPLEFGVDENSQDVEMSSDKNIDNLDVEEFGEDIDLSEWDLIYKEKVDYDTDKDLDAQLEDLNNPKQSFLSKVFKFVSTGTARPNAKSEQDGAKFKSRYRYEGKISDNSREFCRKMIKANKIYRKEDIIKMENQVVNAGWGAKGADSYSIWLYKGGGDCGHSWSREIYAKKSDVKSPLAKEFTPAQTRKQGEIVPKDNKKVYEKPRDMANNGFLEKR
jgi:hypothetical protein